MTLPTNHRDLPRRMLAAVEDRVRLNEQRVRLNEQRATEFAGNVSSRRRAVVRSIEASEILGILRNVVRAYENTDTPI